MVVEQVAGVKEFRLWVPARFSQQTSVTEAMARLGGDRAHEVGGFEVGDTEWHGAPQELFEGEFEIVDEIESNTGKVLFVELNGEVLAVKTELRQNHGYLYFSEKWVRLWSLAAECDMFWRQPDGRETHLGVLGAVRTGDGKVRFTRVAQIEGDNGVEPALVMRAINASENLFKVAEDDPQRYRQNLPTAIRNLLSLSRDIPEGYDRRRLKRIDTWLANIKYGNLWMLREDEDKGVARVWDGMWLLIKQAALRHKTLLEERELSVRHGDTSGLNGEIVRLNDGREVVLWFDPLVLPLVYERDGAGEVREWGVALWNIENPEKAVGALTADLRLFQRLAEKRGEAEKAKEHFESRRLTLTEFVKGMGMGSQDEEGALPRDREILVLFGEAYWFQVRAEINLREARRWEAAGKLEEANHHRQVYEALRDLCRETYQKVLAY